MASTWSPNTSPQSMKPLLEVMMRLASSYRRYQPKEQVGFLPAHRQIAQFIDDEQFGGDRLLQLPLQPIFCLRPGVRAAAPGP